MGCNNAINVWGSLWVSIKQTYLLPYYQEQLICDVLANIKNPFRGVFLFLGKSAIIGKTDIERTNADF